MSIEFQLFRITVYPSEQRELFEINKTPSEILKEVIVSSPSAELRRGITWHIGNTLLIDNDSYYFRIGKTSRSTLEIFENGNFIDEELDTSPYTHVFLDYRLELCAIARKNRLSQSVIGIANQLTRLFNKSEYAQSLGAKFEINIIKDPSDFISHLNTANTIERYWVNFKKPNLIDANKEFYKPMEKLLKDTHGDIGKTQLKGENLNPEPLIELTRTAASSGNDAGATMGIIINNNVSKIRRRLSDNPVMIYKEDIAEKSLKMEFIDMIRRIYFKIRGNIDDN